MALLADAIRQSDSETAAYRTQDGTAVIVQRITGREEPYSQEEYAVRTQVAGAPPEERFAADNLLETLVHLQDMRLPGFNPESDGWVPASGPSGIDPQSPSHTP